jgi:hypothetical protein
MTHDYTYHVGEKFNPDGSARAYPGVTIICFAHPSSKIYQAGEQVQDALKALPFHHKFGLLPPSSFHMTVFSLICDQRRTTDEWSSKIAQDIPLIDADQFFIEAVSPIPPPSSFRMVMTYIGGWGMSFRLSPADEATYFALQTYRDQVSRASGVRYPDHLTYEYHLTLAYQLITLTDAEFDEYAAFRLYWGEKLRGEIGVFETPTPMLTFFEDMFAFVAVDHRHILPSRAPK